MKILCIAPNAPPRNSAEAIQVGRYLAELSHHDDVMLVTEPEPGGWIRDDNSQSLETFCGQRLVLSLPAHRLVLRVLMQKAIRSIVPIADHWPRLFARRVAAWGADTDIIYSRSSPFRAATLAAAVKRLTGKPWIMHLSDPWVDNPDIEYGAQTETESTFERECFQNADLIALTNERAADFYRKKYNEYANKIFISPNVLKNTAQILNRHVPEGGVINLVFTGALYGGRQPHVLLDALESLPLEYQKQISITFAGNIDDRAKNRLSGTDPSRIRVVGQVPFDQALSLQARADILITLEPAPRSEHDNGVLLAKLLDYLPTGKPILSICGPESLTAQIVDGIYGWAVSPNATEVAKQLIRIIDGDENSLMKNFSLDLPNRLFPDVAVAHLRSKMKKVIGL